MSTDATSSTPDTTVISIRLPNTELALLRDAAAREDRAVSYIARRAIREHLARTAA